MTVADAYLPGTLVTEDGAEFTLATSSEIEAELLILSNRQFYDHDIATAYASGDTGVAYRPKPGEVYQVRLAAATYAKGDTLTIGAGGRLRKTSTDERVLAFFDGVAGEFSVGDLADVRIANSFLTASA
jgi:hypothetical protein